MRRDEDRHSFGLPQSSTDYTHGVRPPLTGVSGVAPPPTSAPPLPPLKKEPISLGPVDGSADAQQQRPVSLSEPPRGRKARGLSYRMSTTREPPDRCEPQQLLGLRRRVLGKASCMAMLCEAFSAYADRPCIGTKQHGQEHFDVMTFRELGRRCFSYGTGLRKLITETRNRSRSAPPSGGRPLVGVACAACDPAWLLTDVSCSLYGLTLVALPHPLSADSLRRLCGSSLLLDVLVVDEETATRLALHAQDALSRVHHLVVSAGTEIAAEVARVAHVPTLQVSCLQAVEDLGGFTDQPLDSAAHVITARHASATLSGSPPPDNCSPGLLLLAISEAAWAARVRVLEESVGSLVYLCCQPAPLHSLVHRRRVWSVLLNGGLVGLSSSADDHDAALADCQLLRPTVVSAGAGLWLQLYREHVRALRRATQEEDVIAGLETDRQCVQEAEAKALRALARRLGGHVEVVELGGEGPPVSAAVVAFLQRGLGGGCEVRALLETDQCGPIADAGGVAVPQVLLHSLQVEAWEAPVTLEPASPLRPDWALLHASDVEAAPGRLCVSSPFLCEGSGDRFFWDEQGRCFAVTDEAAAVHEDRRRMTRLGPLAMAHRLLGGADQAPGGGVIASASRAEAALAVSKYVEAVRVRGEAAWRQTLVGYVVPSELLRQGGGAEEGGRRKLHVDLYRLGSAAKLRPEEMPAILVICGDAASLPPPVGPLPASLQDELRQAVSVLSAPQLSSLSQLSGMAAGGCSPMALLARLLAGCLGSTAATAQQADLMRCILSHSNAEGELDEGPPSLTELGLDCGAALLLAVCFSRVFGVCLPVGLLLLPSTTPLSLLAAIRRHARKAASFKDPEQLLSLARLPSDFRRTLLLALREHSALPTALKSPGGVPTAPQQVLNVAPFPQLHDMHHDRLQQGGALAGLQTRHVLLVGGVGFLGQHLLRALLAHDRFTVVHCLVRARSEEQAAHRVKGQWGPRLHVLAGDVALPCLGLGPTAFCRLAGLVDSVFISINGESVAGARNVLLFSATHHRKAVHYMSCLGTLTEDLFSKEGWSVAEAVHKPDARTRLETLSAEMQGKYVFEQLLCAASEDEDLRLPVTIYRAGCLVGDSTGACPFRTSSTCLMPRLVGAMLQLRMAPQIEAPLDMNPVDFVARSVVAAASALGCNRRAAPPVVLHVLCRNHRVSMPIIEQVASSKGIKLERVSVPVFLQAASLSTTPLTARIEELMDYLRLPRANHVASTLDTVLTSSALRHEQPEGYRDPLHVSPDIGQLIKFLIDELGCKPKPSPPT